MKWVENGMSKVTSSEKTSSAKKVAVTANTVAETAKKVTEVTVAAKTSSTTNEGNMLNVGDNNVSK